MVLKRTGGKITGRKGATSGGTTWLSKPAIRPGGRDERRRSAVYSLHLRFSGKPKGVLHTTGGYLVYAALPLNMSLIIIRVISTGAPPMWLGYRTQLFAVRPAGLRRDHVMFEGVPNWPTPARMAQVVDSIRSIFSIPRPRRFVR